VVLGSNPGTGRLVFNIDKNRGLKRPDLSKPSKFISRLNIAIFLSPWASGRV
jgi:hypothetical protein